MKNLPQFTPKNEYTIILAKPNEANKNSAQTKLKVVKKSRAKIKFPTALLEDEQPLHASKRKRTTIKLKRNPLMKVNLDNKIIQNYKDKFHNEKALPVSWKLASLDYELSMYTVDGFDEYCKPFDFKEKMNGFEIGLESQM